MFKFIHSFLLQFFTQLGLSDITAKLVSALAIFVGLVIMALVLAYIIRLILVGIAKLAIKRRERPWLSALLKEKIFRQLSFLFPFIFVYKALPEIFGAKSGAAAFFMGLINLILIFNVAMIISCFLNALTDVLAQKEGTRDKPIKSYMQVIKIIVWVLCSILMISIIVNKSPAGLLAGIGAFSAVLLLVFQDTIAGFVYSIQLSSNDLVRIGDWITSPKYGVDGTVTEVNLVSVKVMNFDNTIVSMPIKYVVTDSFQNWRNMRNSGIRRVMRSLNIDVSSIQCCTPDMLENFKKIDIIHDYIVEKQAEIEKYNAENKVSSDIAPNGRHLTNLGVLRTYMRTYLQQHPQVDKGALIMVRQLQPKEFGMPLELYCFVKVTEWQAYEKLQADLFDHFYAVLPYFNLRPYQRECQKMDVKAM